MEFNFETFDKRNGRLTKAPELTIQSKGAMSMNASAVGLLGPEPEAVELLFDREANVMGIRAVSADTAHAYPVRPIGKGATYVISARAFFNFYEIPLGTPVRRDVKKLDDGTLIVDLNDPGRVVISNRNRAKAEAAAAKNPAGDSNPGG